MAIKLSNIRRKLSIKDFREREGKWYLRCGDHQICFWETYGGWAKMNIEVWYLEGDKKYLRDQEIISWKSNATKYEIKERNRLMWYWINKFYKSYCYEKDV